MVPIPVCMKIVTVVAAAVASKELLKDR